jgi:O-methyltransferase involved in polyketide biosynthesis
LFNQTEVALTGIPETMLLTLYNRAMGAMRPELQLCDPEAIRIYRSLNYDFARNFGDPKRGSAARAVTFDRILKDWIGWHPDGCVVSLGEGLETQNVRVDNGRIRWLTVDLPDAIAVRERFLRPTERFRHVPQSALDFSWMDEVSTTGGVFFVIQGLLPYLRPEEVRSLLCEIGRRFPEAELLFDFVPAWMSRRHPQGLALTKYYRLPPMPWGVDHNAVEPILRKWIPNIDSIRLMQYNAGSTKIGKWIVQLIQRVPLLCNKLLGIAHVHFASVSPASLGRELVPLYGGGAPMPEEDRE